MRLINTVKRRKSGKSGKSGMEMAENGGQLKRQLQWPYRCRGLLASRLALYGT